MAVTLMLEEFHIQTRQAISWKLNIAPGQNTNRLVKSLWFTCERRDCEVAPHPLGTAALWSHEPTARSARTPRAKSGRTLITLKATELNLIHGEKLKARNSFHAVWEWTDLVQSSWTHRKQCHWCLLCECSRSVLAVSVLAHWTHGSHPDW